MYYIWSGGDFVNELEKGKKAGITLLAVLALQPSLHRHNAWYASIRTSRNLFSWSTLAELVGKGQPTGKDDSGSSRKKSILMLSNTIFKL